MALLSLSLFAQKSTQNYIEKYKDLSIELMNKTDIPASIILGISAHETGYGTSYLSKNKNNYFGIKKGKYYRGYVSDTASFNHFCEFISNKKFYYSLKGNKDYNLWVKAIQRSGYSQSSAWASRVSAIIKKNKLYQYDTSD